MKKVSLKYNIIFYCIASLLIAGCGVKGNPVRLMDVSNHMQILRNVKAAVAGNSVSLEWDVDNNDLKNNYVAIERRERGRSGKQCKKCSGNYERIGKVVLNQEKQESKNDSRFTFSDKKVTRGKTYYYRLLFCHESDVCSESVVTEINFK